MKQMILETELLRSKWGSKGLPRSRSISS
uniref:Uncharacterized protein n=1 Tax=Anguilla anguilla TaxID=7936 RepID=A0A0E9XWZ4_ANGAN